MNVAIKPSGRIDYCGECKAEHGYNQCYLYSELYKQGQYDAKEEMEKLLRENALLFVQTFFRGQKVTMNLMEYNQIINLISQSAYVFHPGKPPQKPNGSTPPHVVVEEGWNPDELAVELLKEGGWKTEAIPKQSVTICANGYGGADIKAEGRNIFIEGISSTMKDGTLIVEANKRVYRMKYSFLLKKRWERIVDWFHRPRLSDNWE